VWFEPFVVKIHPSLTLIGKSHRK